ncbi:peptidyl-prolyl cis-trans isomerase [Achlya hypogyna]|uniref:Peptidyl-prolyl cis-trans isomerase n=1 Tax=Achlya hypogyna TaxID=1202772 RepID=A0A1V9YP88_ACHHY|nr:peptidyl-prolyl cis-trans isomerase [Achlya hypogyna]
MTDAATPQSIYEFTMGSARGNPVVYLDVAIGHDPLRRLRFELFYQQLPLTANNFRLLCTGEMGSASRTKWLWYKGCSIHRVIPGFMMQGGDITHGEHPIIELSTGNGIGGTSATGRNFDDEHVPGALSMAHQANTNKSQFFICFNHLSWLDGKHVVFGQLIAEDMVYLKDFEDVGTSSGLPLKPIMIQNAGQLCGRFLPGAPDADEADAGDE